MPCPGCDGSGSSLKNPCSTCSGEGRVVGEVSSTVKIPPGVDSGMQMRVSGAGASGIRKGMCDFVLFFLPFVGESVM